MGRERRKNKCFSMLTCAGVGGGGGDVAADPTNAAADSTATAVDCHCEEGKVLSDKSRWSFRRRSTRHRVLRNNENNNKENPNTDPINENDNNININNFSSPKYSSATEKSIVEQEKPKENNNVITSEIEEKLIENNNDKSTDDNSNIIIEEIEENQKVIDEKKEETTLVIKETEEKLNVNLKEDLEEKELENLHLKDDLIEKESEKLNLKEDMEEKELENLKDDLEEKNLENLSLKDNLGERELETNSDQFELTEKNENGNENIEPVALVIQEGFKGYMAGKETIELDKVVKIQALVRGFIVRSQMAGTLRCFLAIIKMQSMVRSHQVKGGRSIYISNENVVLNGFASKIIDTMPKTKVVHIKCDPYIPNSTWEWLERWNYTIIQSNSPDLSIQNEIFQELVDQSDPNQEEISQFDSNSNITPVDFESQTEIQKTDADSVKIEEREVEIQLPKMEENSNSVSKFEFQTEKSEPKSNDEETKLEENEPIKENSNLEKPINPAFAAAQMKFQSLSSIPSPNSNPIPYTFPSPKNNNTTNNDIKNNNNNIYNNYLLKATSECGTEISISSTLDSPDRSETEGGEIVLEIQNLELKNYKNTPDSEMQENYQNTPSSEMQENYQNTPSSEMKNYQNTPETPKPLEPETPNPNSETENNTSVQIEKDEKTPQLQTPQKSTTTITTTDLNETPSSQASVTNNNSKKTKKTKKDKKHHKKASKPSVRRSLTASPISDSHHQIGDSEPRMSNSSLPSYMQATLSARAKACSGSLKTGSSPDLNVKNENNINGSEEKKIVKRLSGGANVNNNNNIGVNNIKELSPRMQRSQSHESEKKGNGASNLNGSGSADKRWQI